VTVDEEGGFQQGVPKLAEGPALGAKLTHGVDLFLLHGFISSDC
jgi:hypothetical protein